MIADVISILVFEQLAM